MFKAVLNKKASELNDAFFYLHGKQCGGGFLDICLQN